MKFIKLTLKNGIPTQELYISVNSIEQIWTSPSWEGTLISFIGSTIAKPPITVKETPSEILVAIQLAKEV